MQVSGTTKVTYTHKYESTMFLLMIDFTYLEEKYGELVVKYFSVFNSCSSRASSCGFKRPYRWENLSFFNVKMNEAIYHCCNLNDGDLPY